MKAHIKKIHDNINNMKIHVLIPAAGIGKRMKTYGCKSLINITPKKTIIDLQLDHIKNSIPNHKVVLVSGFDSDRLMSHVPNTIINVENERFYDTNVARSISIGLRTIADAEHVLIIMGDLVFNEHVLTSIDYNYSSVVMSTHMSENEVGCIINNGYVENMMYDLDLKWGHIVYLTGTELKLMKDISFNRKNEKKFCFELINEIINNNGKFKAVWNKDIKIIDIDTSKDLQYAQEII